MHFAISCGGTGGHTLPGLATAQALVADGHRVTLVLTDRATDRTTAATWAGPHLVFPADYLSARHPVRSLKAILTLRRSRAAAIRAFRADRPDAVLVMGSYASFPAASAAVACGIPLVLHESNVIPGRLVEWFALKAAAIAAGFEELRDHLRGGREVLVATGTPIRPELVRGAALALAARGVGDGSRSVTPHLLVTGGSQGARSLNTAAAEAFIRLCAEGVPFAATHLAGQADYERVAGLYAAAKARPNVMVLPFSADMATHYGKADFALTRAGASTLAELVAFRLPALLVPYPLAAKDHQMANARAVQGTGAVAVVADAELTSDGLHDYLKALLAAPDRLAAMRAAYASSSLPDPAEAPKRLAALLVRVAKEQ